MPTLEFKEDDYYLSYGIFDGSKLSNIIYKKVWSQFLSITGIKYDKPYINVELIDEKNLYVYNNELLFKYNLLSSVTDEVKKNLILEDLVYCDDIALIEFVLENAKTKYQKDEYQTHINYLLKNISSNLNNYYNIIVLLIDNGAYYEVMGELQRTRDIAKTNFIYRLSKDMIALKKVKQPIKTEEPKKKVEEPKVNEENKEQESLKKEN